MENWLNSNTGTDNGEPAFKIEGKTYKVEKDMTWAQWIESEYNTDKYRIEGNSTNGVVLKNDSIDTIKYCPKTTQIALAKDTIIVGQNYTLSTIKLPIYWYLSETGEYVSATSENDLKTALNNKAQLIHCEQNTYLSKQDYENEHSDMGYVGWKNIQLIEGTLQQDESIAATVQIATPYYKYGEEMKALGDENLTVTIQELLDKMGIDTNNEIETNNGNLIDINEYQPLTPFCEIYLTNSQNDRKYDLNETISISMTSEAIEGYEKENLLILYVEANSNKVSFIEIEDYDDGLGMVKLEFSKLGSTMILIK